jgi:hypothetical protein
LAHFEAGNFGDGIPFVRGFEWGGEEVFFPERLRRVFGINARTAKEKKFFHTRLMCAVDEMILDLEVFVEELGGAGMVGENASNSGGSDEDVFGLLRFVEALNGGGIEQVEFGM